MIRITISLKAGWLRQIKQLARSRGKTPNEIFQEILQAYLKEKNQASANQPPMLTVSSVSGSSASEPKTTRS